jgi:hypothetical protein
LTNCVFELMAGGVERVRVDERDHAAEVALLFELGQDRIGTTASYEGEEGALVLFGDHWRLTRPETARKYGCRTSRLAGAI